jgi:hypothetical protein
MEITGKVTKLTLDNIRFENLKGIEGRCQESLKDFVEGDKVVIFSLGEFRNDGIDANGGLFFVKAEAVDDFLVRFKDTILSKIDKSIETT